MQISRTWLSLPLSLLLLSVAHAEPLLAPEPQEEEPTRSLLAREFPANRGHESLQVLESRDWRRLHLRKGAGLELRRSVNFGEREVVLGVKGPLMKRKRLGLTFEVRF